MKQLTVRGIDEELDRSLKKLADELNLSVNRYVVHVLREAAGLSYGAASPNAAYDDLDHLAGTWSAAEAATFDDYLASSRQIDDETWQ